MNEKLVLDELRTIKLMCIANFIELQEIKRKLDIADNSREAGYKYANDLSDHIKQLDNRLHRMIKDESHQLWEGTKGTA